MEPPLGIAHLKHLMLQNRLVAVPRPDATRILQSGWPSNTIVQRSAVGNRPSGIPFERAAVLDDDFANGAMILGQQRHDVFGITAFREPKKAAQIGPPA
jgi:hypothetical protein